MKKILCHTGPGGFSIDSFLGEGLAQKQEIIYYINLGYLSGGTVVAAISTAGAFLYEVTSETTDLVTIGDLMLKWISLSSRLLVIWLPGGGSKVGATRSDGPFVKRCEIPEILVVHWNFLFITSEESLMTLS